MYNMYECSTTPVPFTKGDKLGTFQSPNIRLEINEIKSIPYASALKNIICLNLYVPRLSFCH
jgi:hypothetical protein